MVTGLHPWCPLPPHPNPPPRRGEGRVGVMLLMSFLQCLAYEYKSSLKNSASIRQASCVPCWRREKERGLPRKIGLKNSARLLKKYSIWP
jgi:hypothetical protein